jgi:phage protein D
MTYTDHIQGEADGLEIQLEDTSGRWQDFWYPVKGSTLHAWLGRDTGGLLDCGEFQVDEIELTGPPDTVTVRGLGATNQKALRTKVSKAHEGGSLKSLASDIAAKHGLSIVGTVPDLAWKRVTQYRETDLGFLRRIALEHGAVFSVKGSTLVFHDLQSLEAQKAMLTLHRTDLEGYTFREKMTGVEGGVSASYFNGDTKELQVVEVELQEHVGDTHKIHRRTEHKGQTQRLAKAALHTRKGFEREGTLTLPGDTRLVAGGNIELLGFGVLEGLWQLKSAKHTVSRSGYSVELEVRHVQA